MPHAEDDGAPAGALVGVLDPAAAAKWLPAKEKRYAECLAAGMSHEHVLWEGIGASAEQRRIQLGLPEKLELDSYVPPAQRLRVTARGELLPLTRSSHALMCGRFFRHAARRARAGFRRRTRVYCRAARVKTSRRGS